MPVNFLLYTALMRLDAYYGDDFTIECPTESGNLMNLFQVAKGLGERLIGIFIRGSSGRRPVYGGADQASPNPMPSDAPSGLAKARPKTSSTLRLSRNEEALEVESDFRSHC